MSSKNLCRELGWCFLSLNFALSVLLRRILLLAVDHGKYSTSIPKSCFFKMILHVLKKVITSMSTTRSCPLAPGIHMSTRE